MKCSNFELKKYTLEDLEINPKYFDTKIDGHAKLSLIDMYGTLFPDGLNEKPIWFIRHCNTDGIRFGSFHRPGDGYLSVQTPLHLDDIAQKDTPVVGYGKIDEKSFGIGAEEPFFEYRFYEDYLTYKETDILDLKAELFPIAIFKHADETIITSQITQPCIYEGTYEGMPIRGIGNFELVFVPQTENRKFNDWFSYIYAYDVGVREDGKKEIAMILLNLEGKSRGFYWLEGEEPVVSREVKMEAKWERLAYVDDDTCVYKDAIFRFGGKEINFNGKWGAKGLTAYPRIELHGQSQVLGTWYEGAKPYKHEISMTFHENMDVYFDRLKGAGFTVLD